PEAIVPSTRKRTGARFISLFLQKGKRDDRTTRCKGDERLRTRMPSDGEDRRVFAQERERLPAAAQEAAGFVERREEKSRALVATGPHRPCLLSSGGLPWPLPTVPRRQRGES